jgi:NADPH-dependent curcumin reductase CurA
MTSTATVIGADRFTGQRLAAAIIAHVGPGTATNLTAGEIVGQLDTWTTADWVKAADLLSLTTFPSARRYALGHLRKAAVVAATATDPFAGLPA